MHRSTRLNLLWVFLLPISILVLGMILYRPLPPRQVAPTASPWSQLGAQAFASGDMQQAISLLNLAAAGQDLQPEGWIMLGDAYQAVGDSSNALRAWGSAGDVPDAWKHRLNLHRQAHDYPAAIADLQALNALQPDEASWVYQLGLLLAATQPDQALPYLNQAAALSSSQKKAILTLQHRIQAALPVSQPAYTLLEVGRALADLTEWDLAAEAFRGATQLSPTYAEAWAFRGEALQHLDIPEGKTYSPAGLDELKYALQLDPDSMSANLFLAIYWRRQGQLPQAIQILESLAQRHEDNAAVQIELGNALAENNDLQTALTHYKRATELAPAEPDGWLALAGFSVNGQYQVRQVALPAARQLLLLTPADPVAIDLMGQALLLLEDPLNAERFFRHATQVAPDYAPARLHLAQVYLLRSENAAARQELNRVIVLAPGSSVAENARRLLETYFP